MKCHWCTIMLRAAIITKINNLCLNNVKNCAMILSWLKVIIETQLRIIMRLRVMMILDHKDALRCKQRSFVS